MVLPMTVGSLFSEVAQKRCVSTATPAAFGPSSDVVSRRPSTGLRPITSKNAPLTTPACTTRGSPKPTIVNSIVENSPKALMVVARDRKSSISGTENVMFSTPSPWNALADVDQAIFAAIDERAEKHAAHDAEDRGVGADAERERHHDGGGQTLGAEERAQTDAHLRPERRDRVEPAAVPDPSHRFARVRDVAELPQRGQPGGRRIFAALDPLLHAEGQVAADFLVEVALVGPHALFLACRRRVHDAADRVHELRPAILLT